MSGKFLSVAQVARELDVSEATVRRTIARGALPAHQFGGRRYSVDSGELADFIAKSRAKADCFHCGKATDRPVGFFRNAGSTAYSCDKCLEWCADHFTQQLVNNR